MSTIPVNVDFIADWSAAAAAKLRAAGYNLSSNASFREICELSQNYERRLVPPRRRHLHYSTEFTCPHELAAGLKNVEALIASGADLTPYLSRGLKKLDYDDALLNDWGVHHLHLGTTIESDGFASRTGPVLFARFDDADAYLIQIMPHGGWAVSDTVRIIHSNWPTTIEPFRLKDVIATEFNPSDAEIAKLRKAGLNYFIEPFQGVVYGPIGGGFTTSGRSAVVAMSCNDITRDLRHLQKVAKEQVAAYLIKNTPASIDKLDFKLEVLPGQVVELIESTTGFRRALPEFTRLII